MVNDLIFFLRNKFIFHGLNVAAKISFQKLEIKDFERAKIILSESKNTQGSKPFKINYLLKKS